MLIKAAFFVAAVWLCMAEGPRIDAAVPGRLPACAGTLCHGETALKEKIGLRLAGIRQELREARHGNAP